MNSYKKYIKRTLIGIAIAMALFVALVFSIYIPFVQHAIVSKIESEIGSALDAEASVGYFDLSFLADLNLENVEVYKGQDTLLQLEHIKLDIAFSPLFHNQVVVNDLQLKGLNTQLDKLIGYNDTTSESTDAANDIDSEKPWEVQLNHLHISNSRMSLYDAELNMDLVIEVGEGAVGVLNIDSFVYDAQDIQLENTRVSYVSPYTLEEDTDTSAIDFIFKTNKVVFINSEFYYNDSLMEFATGGKYLTAENLFVDLAQEDVKMTHASMDQSYFKFIYINDSLETPESDILWKVHLAKAKITNSQFVYDIPYKVENRDAFDNNHMHFTKLSAEANDIFYSEPQISLSLVSGSFNENDRVLIQKSVGDLYMDNQEIRFTNLQIETSESDIALDGTLGYYVKDFDFRDNGKLNLSMDYKAHQWDDMQYFVGYLLEDVPNLEEVKNKPIEMSMKVRGYYDSLDVEYDVIYDHTAKMKGQAFVLNGTQDKGLKYQLDIENSELAKKDIALFVDDKSTMEYVPQQSSFHGNIKGTESQTDVKGQFVSDYGAQKLDASVDMSDSVPVIAAAFVGDIQAKSFYNLHIDSIAFDGQIDGGSFKDITAQADVQMMGVHVDTLFYDSALAHVELRDGKYSAFLYSYDEHADFTIDSKGVVTDSTLESKSAIVVNNFNFKEHDIFTSPEKLHLKSQIIFDVNFNNLFTKFDAKIKDIRLTDSSGSSRLKALDIDFIHTNKETNLHIVSDNNMLFAELDGSLDSLVNNFEKFVDILALQEERPEREPLYFPNIKIIADISEPNELLSENITSNIPQISSISLKADFKNKDNSFDVNLFVPHMKYFSNEFDSLSLVMNGDMKGFEYNIGSGMLIDSLLDLKMQVDGDYKNKALKTHFNIWDKNRVDFIDMTLLSKVMDYGYMMQILGDSLTILSNHWHINQPNSLELRKGNMLANNIKINRANKEIQIQTMQSEKEIGLLLKNIELAVFNRILRNDSLLAGNANAELSASFDSSVFRIDFIAKVDSFRYENYYLGDIDIEKASLDSKQMTFAANLKSARGNSDVKGSIELSGDEKLDVAVNANAMSLDFLNTVLDDYLYDVKGDVDAHFMIKGSLAKPSINGYMQFNKSNFGIVDLQEVFRLNNSKIHFENNKIDPSGLLIFDKNNHKAYFEGSLSIDDNSFLFKNFHIKSNGMELMNSTPEDNEMLNGVVVSDFDIRLNGFVDDLSAKSKIVLDYPTEVNYTFPDDLSVSKDDGIVNFGEIDTMNVVDSVLVNEMRRRQARLMNIFEYLDAELIVKEGCKFNIYFDPSQEDNIHVILDGDVKYLFSKDITQTSGMLDIVKGKLNYSMPMVSMKELDVNEDSYIQITDEISNPFISINATTTIWAQTGDLIENYNRSLDVTVYVYMRGTLDNLVVQFDISPQTSDALVSSKISQMSEKERTMNAVNLLIRGQFASKQSTVTIDVDSYISSLMASALNKLISDRITFVDMSFDIQSVNSVKSNGAVETQSNLFFNVGKSFYHNRIRVNYRSNMSSSVTQKAGQYGSTDSYTERNFTIEYDITKRGNFQAVLFRKDTYEDIMEGDVVSTGGGIKIRKSYKSFGDIFKVNPIK